MTDADTIRNADDLWKLVHLVQDTIGKDGEPLILDKGVGFATPLKELRKLADECDPEYGRY